MYPESENQWPKLFFKLWVNYGCFLCVCSGAAPDNIGHQLLYNAQACTHDWKNKLKKKHTNVAGTAIHTQDVGANENKITIWIPY